MAPIIVLTAAGGQQCAHLIPQLAEVKPWGSLYQLRLVVASQTSLQKLQRQYPHAEVVTADLLSPSDCARIMESATAVYHIGATFHPHETQLGLNVVDAAVNESAKPGSKFQHFVYSSVLSSQLSKLLNHARKRYVEEYLIESGLNWTILQPSHFMEPSINGILAQVGNDKIVFPARFDPARQFSYMSLGDYAEVSARVIFEREKHFFASYALTSTGPMPYIDFVRRVGKVIGRDVSIKQLNLEEATDSACRLLWNNSVGWRRRDGMQRLFSKSPSLRKAVPLLPELLFLFHQQWYKLTETRSLL